MRGGWRRSQEPWGGDIKVQSHSGKEEFAPHRKSYSKKGDLLGEMAGGQFNSFGERNRPW